MGTLYPDGIDDALFGFLAGAGAPLVHAMQDFIMGWFNIR
jgi:hypothetical protein